MVSCSNDTIRRTIHHSVFRRLAEVFATIGETAIQVPNEGNQLFLYTLAHTKKHIIY